MTKLQTLKQEQQECAAIIADGNADIATIRAANERLAQLKYDIAEAQILEYESQIQALNVSELRNEIEQAQAKLKEAWAVYDAAEQAKHQALGKLEQLQGRCNIRLDQIRQLNQQIANVKASLTQAVATR